MAKESKYEPGKLISMFRLAASLRKQMLDAGFTDNGGAIHSAERILNILGLRLCYPGLAHINNLRRYPNAQFSEEALIAHGAGEKILIEHISPLRALTRLAIQQVEVGVTDDMFTAFIKAHFQLALLTPAETLRLNKQNRSKIDPERLKSAGIALTSRLDAVETSAPGNSRRLTTQSRGPPWKYGIQPSYHPVRRSLILVAGPT